MSLQFAPYVLSLVILAAVTIWLMVVAMRRKHVTGARPLAWLMALLTWWLLTYAFQIAGTDLQIIIVGSNLVFFGVAFVPVAWLAFALDYSGYSRQLTLRNLVLLCFVPAATQGIMWADPALRLFRAEVRLEQYNSFWVLRETWGPWYSVHTAYSYVLIGLGIVLLARMFFRSKGLYRGQATTLLIAALIPFIMNLASVVFFKQAFVLDPTPFSFVVTGVMFSLGLFRFRLLDVVPLARDAVVEGIHDGVLVLDGQDRIVDVNPAARGMLRDVVELVIGQSVRAVFPEYADWVVEAADTEVQVELTLAHAEAHWHYEVHLSPLYNRRRQLIGRLLLLRDITARKRAEQALERWIAQFQVLPALSQEIASARAVDDVLPRAARLIQERFPAYHVGILLTDAEGRSALLQAASGEASETLLALKYTLDLGRAGVDLRTGHAISGQISGADPDAGISVVYGREPLLRQARSETVLPLRIGQKRIGFLVVLSVEDAVFDATAIAVLQTAADQLAVAVENARLLEQMDMSIRDMERASGQYTEQAWRSVAVGAGQPLGYRYRQKSVEPIMEVAGESTEEGTFLHVPVILRDQSIGELHLRFPAPQMASGVAPLMQEVANRLALTLESARLYQDTQRRAAREQMIGEVTARMRESLDMQTVLKTTADEVRRAFGLEDLMISLTVAEASDANTQEK
jgi:PAS domain S-box-containing protein